MQERYHIIGLRKTLLSIKYRCFLCKRFLSQLFGPFYLEDAKGQSEKHDGLIFTCLVTRCVHLEACRDLNTDTFLNAYRRFVSRRCQPTTMLSDNGKTFIGASEELKRCVQGLDNDTIYKAMATTNTNWNFNPPYGPHFSGIWERLIQTAKRTLLIIRGSRRLSLDVLRTILVATEAILNFRPLTIVADLPENGMPLTPKPFSDQQAVQLSPTRKDRQPRSRQLQVLEECAANGQPFLETTRQGVSFGTVKEVQMERK